jgi:predicted DNA binding protein
MHAFVCGSPAVERETILERDARGSVTTLLLAVEGDRARYEAALEEVDAVVEWATETHRGGDDARADDAGDAHGTFYVYVRTRLRERERGYHEALDREGTLIVPPVELRADRSIRLTLVGRAADLRAAVEALPDRIDVSVLRTGTYETTRAGGAPVTARQREALRAARAVGYYEVPRTGELADVAAALDCSTSTASTILRRAEARLVAATLEE